jgi:dTDP-4-dehydrorhamnose reductase
MHQDQDQVIQEMLMIHAEPIVTGPLRQNRDSSVSYHMVRGALEITLHHGGTIGDKVYLIEKNICQPSSNSSLRVPAKIFRTIRTLTDSAVFIEVQSGPFTDSDTEWQSILENSSSVRRILVVGATGLIGRQLSRFCEDQGMEVFRASRSVESNQKNSLKVNFSNLSEAFANLKSAPKFDAVVLSAGSTRLRDIEMRPGNSRLINHQSQVSLAEHFVELGCQKLVFLSSNRVFDGKFANTSKFAKYSSTTEYGRQKARAETELLKLGRAVRVIRLTKVLAEDNPLLKGWVSKLTSGREVKAFIDVMVSPVTLDDTVKVITEVVESESESVTQFSATDEISYFEMAKFVARFLQVDVSLVVVQNAVEVGEKPLAHASLECSKFKSVSPSSSIIALQKVLEKMI